MKITVHLTIALALACSLSVAFAQSEMMETSPTPAAANPSPSAAPAKNPAPNGGGGAGRGRDFMKERVRENLPPDVRQRFDEARQKALQDPKIQDLQKTVDNANREFFKAMRDKMLEIDPGLGDLVKSHFTNNNSKKDGKEPRKEGDGTPGMARLTDAERQQLMAARAKAKADPTVQDAEKARDAATTPAERTAATEAFHKAMRDALLKADPSIAPILEKMAPPAKASQTPDVADADGTMMKQ